jgi:hypothetical protein
MPESLSPTVAAAAVDEPERASFEAWLARQDSDFAQVKQAARPGNRTGSEMSFQNEFVEKAERPNSLTMSTVTGARHG